MGRKVHNKLMIRNYITKVFNSYNMMSVSHFMVQTRKYFLVNVTVVTLGQGPERSSSTFLQNFTFFVLNM